MISYYKKVNILYNFYKGKIEHHYTYLKYENDVWSEYNNGYWDICISPHKKSDWPVMYELTEEEAFLEIL